MSTMMSWSGTHPTARARGERGSGSGDGQGSVNSNSDKRNPKFMAAICQLARAHPSPQGWWAGRGSCSLPSVDKATEALGGCNWPRSQSQSVAWLAFAGPTAVLLALRDP